MVVRKTNIKRWVLIAAVLIAMPLHAAHADSDAQVLQTYIMEQTMTVFTDVELRSGGLRCAVSNQSAEITAFGLLSDEHALTKTTVLVDVSTSMPGATRNGVLDTLGQLIKRKSANEEIKLVTLGDELSVIQDFSPDRYDLANALNQIKFDAKQSKIYDSIYNTIPSISSTGGQPTFYRTIIITDGVDDTVSGVTKEELFIRLQNEHYPVDVVAVSKDKAAENKDLSAIVRMSGGRYFTLVPNTDAAELAHTLDVGEYFYFEAAVPAVLLDGTTRQVDIGDGAYSMSIDVKFPVLNPPVDAAPAPTEPNEEAADAEDPGPTTEPEPAASPLLVDTAAPKAHSTMLGDYSVVISIGAGIALIVIAAVIITVTAMRRKKKNSVPRHDSGAEMGYSEDTHGDICVDKTEFVSDAGYAETQYTIKISSSNDPSKTWTLPVNGDLLIGRAEHCPVRLEDKSVSREHCKIAIQGPGLVVEHLGTTNKTSLNGSNVAGRTPLHSGDTIKIGREALHVDYIQTLGSPPQKPEQPATVNRGQTESIF